MKFSRIGRRLWRRPRPKLGCGSKGREREREYKLIKVMMESLRSCLDFSA
jgi:hypothetical protein